MWRGILCLNKLYYLFIYFNQLLPFPTGLIVNNGKKEIRQILNTVSLFVCWNCTSIDTLVFFPLLNGN